MRTEAEIFSELEEICASKGYIHILASIVLKDDTIHYSGKMQESDMDHLYSKERLIRSEISTLAGLMIKNEINFSVPSSKDFQVLVSSTYKLMSELHEALNAPFRISPEKLLKENIHVRSSMLRELFYYCGESAYYFQFRDFATRKYSSDNAWFVDVKKFSVNNYGEVLNAICSIYQSNLKGLQSLRQEDGVDQSRILDIFTITKDAIVELTGLKESLVQRILDEFSISQPCNCSFSHLNDFNSYNAKPLIQLDDTRYVLLQIYSIAEAFYESPYYWMLSDKGYLNESLKNRGDFAESFTAEKLQKVFGEQRVYKNVNIVLQQETVGEIDVLVLFSDRAIVIQDKSKKLTLEARKGNDQKIKEDFLGSVQSAYDQAYSCSKLLGNPACKFMTPNKQEVPIRSYYKEIYPICVVLDVYPALNFQVRDFLKYESTDVLQPPFVLDIFVLDVISEFLTSPIRFLSYINIRANYLEKISSSNEFSVLSLHLKQNLYIDEEVSHIYLDDSISASLDLAMLARRDAVNAPITPEGILTQFVDSIFGKLIASLENEENEAAINLSFVFLQAGEETIGLINDGLKTTISAAIKDGGTHDFGFGIADTGVTFHCNNLPKQEAVEKLLAHASLKKYTQKRDNWFAVLMAPNLEPKIMLCVHMNDTWEYEKDMEEAANILFQSKPNPKRNESFSVGIKKNQKKTKGNKRKLQRKARRKQRKK